MGSRNPVGGADRGWSADASHTALIDEVAWLTHRAGDVFATSSDLRDWIVCVLHQRRFGIPTRPRARCQAVSAAACAIGFRGDCPMASAPHEFDAIVRSLSTQRLEALLALQHDTFGRRPDAPAGARVTCVGAGPRP